VSFRIYGNTNKCIDIPSNNQIAGQTLQLWDCNEGSEAQTFTVAQATGASGAYYNIISSTGLCVEVAQASSFNEARVQLWNCNSGLHQAFLIEKVAGYDPYVTIKPVHALAVNKCFDNRGGGPVNGNAIQIYDCNPYPTDIYWAISFAATSSGSNLTALYCLCHVTDFICFAYIRCRRPSLCYCLVYQSVVI
jgi:hypothetical protein